MNDLRDRLIRLGSEYPDLQSDIEPVIDRIEDDSRSKSASRSEGDHQLEVTTSRSPEEHDADDYLLYAAYLFDGSDRDFARKAIEKKKEASRQERIPVGKV